MSDTREGVTRSVRVDILGTHWEIIERTEAEDSLLKDSDGYTDWTTKRIVVQREIDGNLADMDCYVKKVKRHEITHAFLEECGLSECSGETTAWARNEEMVDWFARLGQKIFAAWKAAGAV